jgi:chaperonin cofactor prefoldin
MQNQSSLNEYNETITELRANNNNLENVLTTLQTNMETKNIEFSNLEKQFQEKSNELNELD